MGERGKPEVYSIAAHRGFADALVAGLVPRYSEGGFGLARLTLLLPSRRAARNISEAFIRLMGSGDGSAGMLMPRMAVVGDLDLDEALGPLLDPLGSSAIPPAIDPMRRWFELADLVPQAMRALGRDAPPAPALLRLARDIGATMDRLIIEDVAPERLWEPEVLRAMEELSEHWKDGTKLFFTVQTLWRERLKELDSVDAATRRNLLFREAAQRWKAKPPQTPIVAAGVTSSAPELARLLRVVAELPKGAVLLPDLDLSMRDEVWTELGNASAPRDEGDPFFGTDDAVTHPQFHLKLLLNRMGIARGEVQSWHRKGEAAAPPARSHAVSSLFLPPEASKTWIDLPPEKRKLSGIRLMQCDTPEHEAQSIALLIREAIEEPEKRVALVTPDRGLASRVVQHLRRWNITADDTAGRPLTQTPAGRLFLLLVEVMAERAAPVPLMALLGHPLVKRGEERRDWLRNVRRMELNLRGAREAPGLDPLAAKAEKAQILEWWSDAAKTLLALLDIDGDASLTALLDRLIAVGEALCGEGLWAREDGRALANFVEELRLNSEASPLLVEPEHLPQILSDAMDGIAIRPPYGGHPRVSIYGLLESRMSRAELVICGGLTEGSWPATPAVDSLLAPAVLRALGVPGADFRIGLSAHDLVGAMGAPEVVLSHAARSLDGPAIPSRFVLRIKALLGEKLLENHRESRIPELARAIDSIAPIPAAEQPKPMPSAEQRNVRISVTALDRLRSDPYQFYASSILGLKELEALDAEPSPAWQGTLAHEILEDFHNGHGSLEELMEMHLAAMHAHPMARALWRPRLAKALEWVAQQIEQTPNRRAEIIERWGEITVRGAKIFGKADRIDLLDGGTMAVIDYKTGTPPTGSQVEAGYALQLGTLGLMAEQGAFGNERGQVTAFEYWSLGKKDDDFGYITSPVKAPANRSRILPEEFLPLTSEHLNEALDKWILGDAPFTARENPDAPVYATYDQLMRLEEWLGREQATREKPGSAP
ncbi:double-strand break repair protein AddB [Altererythrobacter sp. MF3-039]|uniref:double-strand break repair protein AddB n=1 Tax=Altererythrobacter sp. MF3-039 TaxID=3252901 RepID=UPI00390CDA80